MRRRRSPEISKRRKPRSSILLVTVIMTFALVAPASANFGSSGTAGVGGTTNGVWLTNNNYFVVYKRSLSSTYAAGVDATINNDYNTVTGFTALTLTRSSCIDAYADTCVYDSYYGDNGLNGWNSCWGSTSGSHPNQQCSVTWVRINQTYSPPATRIACHEIAHSTGLRHTNNSASCVKRTADGGRSSVLSSHDRSHLRNEY